MVPPRGCNEVGIVRGQVTLDTCFAQGADRPQRGDSRAKNQSRDGRLAQEFAADLNPGLGLFSIGRPHLNLDAMSDTLLQLANLCSIPGL